MTSRAARVNTIPAGARLSGHVGDLMDVSLTGALVLLDIPLPVESRHLMRLGADTQALELRAKVVRVQQVSTLWRIGVMFVDVTPEMRRAIPAAVARLLAALDPGRAGPAVRSE